MDNYFGSLKKFKYSSTFYRQARTIRNEMQLNPSSGQRVINRKISTQSVVVLKVLNNPSTSNYPTTSYLPEIFECNDGDKNEEAAIIDINITDEAEIGDRYYGSQSDDENENELPEDYLISNLRKWAIEKNIPHSSIKDLLSLYNTSYNNDLLTKLPNDPRTLLFTPIKNTEFIKINDGLYWHNGFQHCLQTYFTYLYEPKAISCNFNIDGIPLYRSSKQQFWPILFTIYEIKDFVPMVVGIYSGSSKPNAKLFLKPFVEELSNIIRNGLIINGHMVAIKIRCFICDAPARSLIKGTVNFNAYSGCQKCKVIGEYDRDGRHMSYPRTDADRRTDDSFRKQSDPEHHKEESVLLGLPMDMVQDVIVCDMLHQLHVGITKRLLLYYVGQLKTKKKTGKWDSITIAKVNQFLNNCRMPSEINRAVRELDTISFWKATEFRTFFYYIGVIIFRSCLDHESYLSFLCLYCAITICSNDKYLKDYLDIANVLLLHYIEMYINMFGEDTISCNVHNLCHLTEEVSRFGRLDTFSAYPFESKLFKIKNLMRSGAKPLAQAAKRMSEFNSLCIYEEKTNIKNYPVIRGTCKVENYSILPNETKYFKKIEVRDGLTLANDEGNKWFSMDDGEIVAMKYAVNIGTQKFILGNSLRSKDNFFTEPMHSFRLGIYISNGLLNNDALYTPEQVKWKFVCNKYEINQNNFLVFIPLIHTV